MNSLGVSYFETNEESDRFNTFVKEENGQCIFSLETILRIHTAINVNYQLQNTPVISTVDIITHEQIICIRDPSTDGEKL